MATFLSDTEFTQLASEEQIAKTMQALEAHGIRAVIPVVILRPASSDVSQI